MANPYDFTGLTEAEQGLLTFGGWHAATRMPQPTREAAEKLAERGLVVLSKQRVDDDYFLKCSVPIGVHIAWCQHCSEIHGA